MSGPSLRDPLRRPAFRRLAFSYGVNELGDWLGLIALSVLVFEQTDSALATALLFLGTGFLPALLTPVVVARLERPPPRFVLPVIYAGEAAAFGALALLADNFSLAAVVAVAFAVMAALAKLYGPLPVRWLAVTYIEIFRGTSALVQLFWLYFVLPMPPFNVEMSAFTVAIVGLGLHIVKSFVELHGGTVRIETAPNEGTTVICLFPLNPAGMRDAAE